MHYNANLTELVKIVPGGALAAPAAARYVSMKGHERVAILIQATNAGAGVTGTAITLQQATSVGGAGAKALPFTRVAQNVDTAAGVALTETAVVGNTFTTDATVSKNLVYVVEVQAEHLDADMGYDCIRAVATGGAAVTVGITYLMHGAKFGEGRTALNPLVD